jgi:hypothetical protein
MQLPTIKLNGVLYVINVRKLTPLTSKGNAARCDVTIPVEDIPALIKQLQKFI